MLNEGDYYIFNINHQIIDTYPKFAQKHTKNIVGRYSHTYDHYGKESVVFEHRLMEGHHIVFGLFTMMAENRAPYDDYFTWITHVYKDRISIVKNITPLIKKIVSKWKEKVRHKKCLIYWTMKQCGLNCDLARIVINAYFDCQNGSRLVSPIP
jgi:hypothetical protein